MRSGTSPRASVQSVGELARRGGLVFFGRKIQNEQTIDACLVRFSMEFVRPELKDWIEITVEDNRDLRFPADLANTIEKVIEIFS